MRVLHLLIFDNLSMAHGWELAYLLTWSTSQINQSNSLPYMSLTESYYFKSLKQTAYNAPLCSVTHAHAWTEIIWLSTWDWHLSLQTQPVLLSASYNTETAEAEACSPPHLIYQGNFSLHLRYQVSTMSYISYKHFSTNKIQGTLHKNLFSGSHHSHISKTLSSYSQHAFCWQCWQHTQGSRYMIQ